jgi:chemotaxis response regulator CheB
VILTGASADGALGAKAVACSGGEVLVQVPSTAESPIAPAAALAMVPSARSMTIEQIANTLARRCGDRAQPTLSTREEPPERG